MTINLTIKKLFIMYALVLFGFSAIAQDFYWAKSCGSAAGNEVGTSVVIDASGNSYTTGYFYSTVDFDPGNAEYNLTSEGDADIFVLKLDASGNFLWAKGIGSTGADKGMGIALDASGNIYTVGSFSVTVDFDPGAGVINLTSLGLTDIFVLKLDPSGNFMMAQRKGGRTNDAANGIALDASGNIFITGTFSGQSGNPGDEWVSIKGTPDAFVSKLNAAGTFLWSKLFGDVGNDYGKSITVDAAGNIYTTGSFSGYAGISPGTFYVVSAGKSDAFILKINADGTISWFKNLGGTEDDFGNSIAVDGTGNVFTTGSFKTTVDFDPASETTFNLTSAGGADIFISKLTNTGSFSWAKKMGGPNDDAANSIKLDAFGNIYTTGYFNSTVDFDPGAGEFNLTSAGSTDIFISKLYSSGDLVFAKKMGGTLEDVGNSIAVDNTGKSYSTGFYTGTANFDPGTGSYDLVSLGLSDIYVSLLLPKAPMPVMLLNFTASKKMDDVVLSWQTATESNSDRFEMERSIDGAIFKKIGEVQASGNSNSVRSYVFIDKNAGNGLSVHKAYYRFRQFDFDGKFFMSSVKSIDLGQDKTAIYIFPNPVRNVATIYADASYVGLIYSIKDETGRIVLKGTLSSTNTSVDFSQLRAGIYFVNVGSTNTKAVKIVKH